LVRTGSIPDISWVKFNTMSLQYRQKFCLKIALPMMLFLAENVLHGRIHLRTADGECAVAFLPLKGGLGTNPVHPTRRRRLYLTNCSGICLGSGQGKTAVPAKIAARFERPYGTPPEVGMAFPGRRCACPGLFSRIPTGVSMATVQTNSASTNCPSGPIPFLVGLFSNCSRKYPLRQGRIGVDDSSALQSNDSLFSKGKGKDYAQEFSRIRIHGS